MRKKQLFWVVVIVLTTLISAEAAAAPYYSYMIDRDGHYRFSPGLYEPSHVINVDVTGINDIYIAEDDTIYAALTGNNGAEVLILDKDENVRGSVGSGILMSANGVFADQSGRIYVADPSQAAVFIFNPDGSVHMKIEKPTSPLYGLKTPYKPMKLVADRQKNIYILSEGTTNGIVQLNEEGEFLGYFGVNLSGSTVFRRFQKMLFSEEIMANFIKNVPPSMSNIAIDRDGLIYATTKGDTQEPLKKINIAGENLFEDVLVGIYDDNQLGLESATCDSFGNVFALSGTTGHIFIIDSLGNTVGLFGARKEQNAELGLTNNPVSIGVNSQQTIFVADKGSGQIIAYIPTPLMKTVYSALAYYREGRYTEGEELWNRVLMHNSSVAQANNAIGLAQQKKDDYDTALKYFELANNKEGYSNAFWEIRQKFLMSYVQYAIIIIAVLMLLKYIWNQVRRRTNKLEGWYAAKARLGTRSGVRELKTITRVMRHPIDVFYDLRYYDTVKLSSAIVLITLAVGFLILADYTTGFSFNNVNTAAGYMYNPIQNIMTYGLVALLFVGSNYLIGSINDGQGKLMQVFRGTALCLMPIVILYIPLIIVSNVLTLQESFIYEFMRVFVFGWSGILVLIMVMQVHDYEFGEAVRSLILTVFTMAIIFIIAVVIYILAREAVNFFASIIEEVVRNAQ